jgi:hypothetical protein
MDSRADRREIVTLIVLVKDFVIRASSSLASLFFCFDRGRAGLRRGLTMQIEFNFVQLRDLCLTLSVRFSAR